MQRDGANNPLRSRRRRGGRCRCGWRRWRGGGRGGGARRWRSSAAGGQAAAVEHAATTSRIPLSSRKNGNRTRQVPNIRRVRRSVANPNLELKMYGQNHDVLVPAQRQLKTTPFMCGPEHVQRHAPWLCATRRTSPISRGLARIKWVFENVRLSRDSSHCEARERHVAYRAITRTATRGLADQ